MSWLLFLLFMIPGTVFLASFDVCLRKTLKSETVNERLLLGVNFFGSGILLSLVLWWSGIPPIQPNFWKAFAITAFLNFFGQHAGYIALRCEEASFIAPFSLLSPSLVLITGFYVLGEKPSLIAGLGVLVSMAGLGYLIKSKAAHRRETFWQICKRKGVILAFLQSLVFSIAFVYDKQAVVASSSLFFIANINLLIGSTSLAAALFSNDRASYKVFWAERRALGPLIVFQSIGSALSMQALHYSLAAYASSIKRIKALWVILLSGKFLGEEDLWCKGIAVGIMLSGMLLTILFG